MEDHLPEALSVSAFIHYVESVPRRPFQGWNLLYWGSERLSISFCSSGLLLKLYFWQWIISKPCLRQRVNSKAYLWQQIIPRVMNMGANHLWGMVCVSKLPVKQARTSLSSMLQQGGSVLPFWGSEEGGTPSSVTARVSEFVAAVDHFTVAADRVWPLMHRQ